MKRLIAIAFALSLGGCASMFPSQEQIAANDDSTCQSYGAQIGSAQYAQCRMQLAQMREQRRMAMIRAMTQPQPQVQPIPLAPLPQAPASQNCISQVVGNTVYTNCH